MTKVPLPCLLARACLPVPASPLGAVYALPSPNFRAFLTCRAPENRKSRPEAATSTPTNPRSRCAVHALSSLLAAFLGSLF